MSQFFRKYFLKTTKNQIAVTGWGCAGVSGFAWYYNRRRRAFDDFAEIIDQVEAAANDSQSRDAHIKTQNLEVRRNWRSSHICVLENGSGEGKSVSLTFECENGLKLYATADQEYEFDGPAVAQRRLKEELLEENRDWAFYYERPWELKRVILKKLREFKGDFKATIGIIDLDDDGDEEGESSYRRIWRLKTAFCIDPEEYSEWRKNPTFLEVKSSSENSADSEGELKRVVDSVPIKAPVTASIGSAKEENTASPTNKGCCPVVESPTNGDNSGKLSDSDRSLIDQVVKEEMSSSTISNLNSQSSQVQPTDVNENAYSYTGLHIRKRVKGLFGYGNSASNSKNAAGVTSSLSSNSIKFSHDSELNGNAAAITRSHTETNANSSHSNNAVDVNLASENVGDSNLSSEEKAKQVNMSMDTAQNSVNPTTSSSESEPMVLTVDEESRLAGLKRVLFSQELTTEKSTRDGMLLSAVPKSCIILLGDPRSHPSFENFYCQQRTLARFEGVKTERLRKLGYAALCMVIPLSCYRAFKIYQVRQTLGFAKKYIMLRDAQVDKFFGRVKPGIWVDMQGGDLNPTYIDASFQLYEQASGLMCKYRLTAIRDTTKSDWNILNARLVAGC